MVKIVCVLETFFLSSEKESVLLSSGDDLNPIHAKVRYCVEIIITNYILCRPTGGRPRLDPRARIQLGRYILECSQRLASCLWQSAQIGSDDFLPLKGEPN